MVYPTNDTALFQVLRNLVVAPNTEEKENQHSHAKQWTSEDALRSFLISSVHNMRDTFYREKMIISFRRTQKFPAEAH